MRPTLVLLRKSILVFSRARAAIAITFVVPIVLIYIFGHVFGLYRTDSGPAGIPLAVVNESADPAAQQLVDALRAEKSLSLVTTAKGPDGAARPLTEADIRAGLRDNSYRFALILPADLVSPRRFGVRLKFLTNPRNEIEAQTVNGLVQKTVFANVPRLLGQSVQANARRFLGEERFTKFNASLASALGDAFGGDKQEIQQALESGQLLPGVVSPTTATANAAATPADAEPSENILGRIVKLETEQVAGKEVKNPMGARIVGGYAIMFLLFAVSGSSAAMFDERRSGVYQRLLSSPVRPSHILWARFYFGSLLGLAQISALFLAGRLFFGLDIFHHAVALFAVALAAAAACSSFGMLIAAVAPSQEAAQGLSTFIVISMSAVGGAWFPVSFMPAYIQSISKCTIVYWSVEGFTDVLWAGQTLVAVLPKIGILAAIAFVVLSFSIWRFNRSRFFE